MSFARVGTDKSSTLSFGDNSVVLNQTPTQNNLLVVGVSVQNPSAVSATVKDSAGNFFTKLGPFDDGSQVDTYLFYEVAPASITTTLTVHVEWAGGAAACICEEYSGTATSSPLDVSASGTSGFTTSTSWTTASATTTQNDLLVGFVGTSSSITGPFSAGTGYTSLDSITASVPNIYMEDELGVAAGSLLASGTVSANGGTRFASAFAAFLPASGGFTAKFKKTLSPMGTKVGSRQIHDYSH